MNEQLETSLASFYNSYLFDKAWNHPTFEYRKNIVPHMLTKSVATGTVKLDKCYLSLPSELDPYQVYLIPEKFLGGINVSSYTDWLQADQVAMDRRVEFRMHDDNGIWFPRSEMYLRTSPDNSGALLVAVKRTVFIKLFGITYPKDDIFISSYFDSDAVNNITITSAIIGDGTLVNTLFAKTQVANFVFLDGRYITVSDVTDIQVPGAHIEIVEDANIYNSFTVDLADINERRNFLSDLDDHVKSIIHIPKAMNPTNRVISHHTLDIFVKARNVEGADMNGRFVHRAIEPYTFTQITHNDFAIPDEILNAYTDTLNHYELTLEVHLRSHERDNVLIRERNYIDLLYKHTDSEIMDFLEGIGPEEFEFWTASHLEASQYTQMISDTPDTIRTEDITKYIDALGYYEALNLVCPRVVRFKANDWKYSSEFNETVNTYNRGGYKIPVPRVLRTLRVFASFLINGRKVDHGRYTTRLCGKDIIIDPAIDLVIQPTDDLTVEMFENVPDNLTKIIPVPMLHSVDLTSNEFKLYEVFTRLQSTKGVKTDYDRTFVLLDDYSDLADLVDLQGQDTLVFKPSAYDREFIVSYDIGFSHTVHDIDSILAQGDTVVIDLNTKVTSFESETTFELDNHDGPTSATGSIIDPMDPLAANERPAWNMFNDDPNFNWSNRWGSSVPLQGLRATYTLDPSIGGQYWLIGYRLGANPDPFDGDRLIHLPTDFEMHVDGNKVHERKNEVWYGNPNTFHSFMLDNPVVVNSTMDLIINSKEVGYSNYVSIDKWEPIFGFSNFISHVPYIGDFKIIAYLNGYELVEGIDFNIVSTKDDSVLNDAEHIVGTEFVLTNVSYLKPSGNSLEILNVRDKSFGTDGSYLKAPVVSDLTNHPFWFDNLSMVIADGLSVKNESTKFGEIELSMTTNRHGAVVASRTLIPKAVQVILDKYRTSEDDDDILGRLTEYFATVDPIGPPILMLPYSHRVISLYISAIVHAALSGDIVLTADPDPDAIADEASEFAYLKEHDLIFKEDSLIDLDFVDVQASYVDILVGNSVLYRAIHALLQKTIDDTVLHRRYDHEDPIT